MKKTSGLAVASMVLGIITACISFIPIINSMSFIIGLLAIIFGVIALVRKTGTGQAIAGLATSVAGIVIAVIVTIALTATIFNEASNKLEEKANKTYQVTYKITSEKPIKVSYGSSKESREEAAIGAWEKTGEIVGYDYVSLRTSPEDFMDSEGLTTCELLIDGESVSREEKLSGYTSCSASGK